MRIKKSWMSEICTPLTWALSQRKNGTKWKKIDSTMMAAMAIIAGKRKSNLGRIESCLGLI